MNFLRYIVILRLATLVVDCSKPGIMTTFLMDFLQQRHIKNVYWFACLSKSEKYAIIKEVNRIDQLTSISFVKNTTTFPKAGAKWFISDCNVNAYLNQINNQHLFNSPYKHLIITWDIDYEEHINWLKPLEILLMSEVIVAMYTKDKMKLFTAYKINNNLIVEDYGTWTEAKGLLIMKGNVALSAQRKNFQKQKIKLGTVIFEDRSLIDANLDDIPSTPDSFFQQDMPILYALLQSLNATMEITVYNSYGYGDFNKTTGKLEGDGVVRDLFDRQINLASTLFLTRERIELFQPLSPIDLWGVKFFLKQPSLSYVKNIYILTLSTSVWVATLVITILFILALYVTLKWENRTGRKENELSRSQQDINVSDVLLLSFEALCQQGTSITSNRVSGRLQLLLLFLLFMFTYVAYSANILVLLKSTAHINTLAELLDSKYEAGGLNTTYVKHYFQSPKDGVLRKFYVKKICRNCYYDQTAGLVKVNEGNFAFFAPIVASYKYILRNFTNYDICSLQELPGYMNMKSYPFVMKSSEYTEVFKIGLLNLLERGLAERSKVRVVRKPRCNNQAGIFQSVRISDCIYLMMIFSYGTVLSVVVLIMEIIFNRTQFIKQ